MTHFEKHKEFHRVFGHPIANKPLLPEAACYARPLSRAYIKSIAEAIGDWVSALRLQNGGMSRRQLRISLMMEEFQEYLQAEIDNDLVEIADALADMCVIADGTAIEYGIPLDDVREEVHRANMSKLGADGQPIYSDDGKIMKGPDYKAPDVARVLLEAEARKWADEIDE